MVSLDHVYELHSSADGNDVLFFIANISNKWYINFITKP